MQNEIIFHQLFEKESSTYTYLIADPSTREAVLIDPVIEMVDRDINLIKELDLNLIYVLDTHVHADHITASKELRKRTGAKVGISSNYDMACADLHLDEGQGLSLGSYTIEVIHTPGHTSGCITYKINDMVFSGDALLVRGCGRTDFQEGSSKTLFNSVREKLFSLPDNTIVYPGHDYKGLTHTSIGIEKRWNPRLKLSNTEKDFIEIMQNLKLSLPKKIKEAVSSNLQCGLPHNEVSAAGFVSDVPTLRPEDLHAKLGHIKIIDVRGQDEFNNELGHIPRAELATLGDELEERLNLENPNREIVFVCRSGKRSAQATKLALSKGFDNVYNMEGGMLKWHELNFPFTRDMGGS